MSRSYEKNKIKMIRKSQLIKEKYRQSAFMFVWRHTPFLLPNFIFFYGFHFRY